MKKKYMLPMIFTLPLGFFLAIWYDWKMLVIVGLLLGASCMISFAMSKDD
jgi:hypothetical protein